MNEAKIRLSAKEAELVLNADWILTKNDILKKAKHLLEAVLEKQQKHIHSCQHLPPEILVPPAKISKGENYKGLPYLVLDHPRYFDKENIFAIRTLFWWGNFFSVTLHLSGSYKTKYEKAVLIAHSLLKEQGIYYCVSDEQWEHHFERDNYLPLEELSPESFTNIIRERSFIKLAKKLPLIQWDNALHQLSEDFSWIIRLLAEE